LLPKKENTDTSLKLKTSFSTLNQPALPPTMLTQPATLFFEADFNTKKNTKQHTKITEKLNFQLK